jgi:hypothetical protein
VATPYPFVDVAQLHFTQSADVMYLAHGSHPPQELRRNSATSFSMVPYAYKNGPFQDFNGTVSKTLTSSAPASAGATVTITATGHTPFTADHIGSIWAIGGATGTPKVQGYVQVTGFTSSTEVTATVIVALSTTSPTDRWAPPAWSFVTGWPKTVEFHDFRLTWGGAGAVPQHPYHTKPGEFTDFAIREDDIVTASSAIVRELAAKEVNAIRGYVSGQQLFATTAGSIWRIDGNSEDTITPTNYRAKRISAKGASTLQPLLAGDTAFFVHRAGKRLYGIEFDLEQDKLVPREMTAFNQEVAGPGFIQLAFEDGAIPILWAVRSDGVAATLTYDLSQRVIAWSRQLTDGFIESVATIPRSTDEQDLTFVVVRRIINGVSKRYVEVFDETMEMDSAITGTFGSPLTTVTGLTHLEGKTVAVKVDGARQANKVVVSGAITGLEPAGTNVMVGLAFTPKVTFLRPAYDTQGGGATLPRIIRTARLVLEVRNSYGIAVNGVHIETRKASDPISAPPPLFSGRLDVGGQVLGNDDPEVTQPLPFRSQVLAAYRYIEVEDD